MSDRIVRALLPGADLLVVAATATEAVREARERHGLASSSAGLLGQGIVGGLLVAALQKADATRINLQVECDGPARGFFVDCDTAGNVRGYVRNKTVRFPPGPRFEAAAMLGAKGYLSILRDIDGQFYRGSVELTAPDVTLSLEHYFAQSEQVETTLQVEVLSSDDDEIGWAGGILVQRLPNGDEKALEAFRARLRGGALESAVRAGQRKAHELVDTLFAGARPELVASYDTRYFCPCSKDRVVRALSTLSNLDLVEMITQDHQAETTCDFCGKHFVVSEAELREILDAIDARDAGLGRKPATDPGRH